MLRSTGTCSIAREIVLSGNSLFTSTTHGSLPYDTVAGAFRRLARSLGLRGEAGKPDARIHDLRHNSECRVIPSGRSGGRSNCGIA